MLLVLRIKLDGIDEASTNADTANYTTVLVHYGGFFDGDGFHWTAIRTYAPVG